MHIVFITQAVPFLPSRDGFRLYGANLIRCLSRRHTIDLVSLAREESAEECAWAAAYCRTVTMIPASRGSTMRRALNLLSTYALGRPLTPRREMLRALRARPEAQGPQVLHVEGSYVAGLIPAALPGVRIISLHDSWTLRCEQMWKSTQKLRERAYYGFRMLVEPHYERMVYPRFDRCVVVAREDARAVRSLVPGCKIEVIPNGIDAEYFHPFHSSRVPAQMVFHGNLSYLPNIECAVEFARLILPKIRQHVPNATFHLVGAQPDARVREIASLPGVQLSADLPDIRRAVGSGEVYVCPMRHGSGVKNKILEAMAMGVPVIGYPGAVAGIECVAGVHVTVAHNAENFAWGAVDLLRKPRLAQSLAQAALALVTEKYSWESRAEAFEGVYRDALKKRGAPSPEASQRKVHGWPPWLARAAKDDPHKAT